MVTRGRVLVIEEVPSQETFALWDGVRAEGWDVTATPLAATVDAVRRAAPDVVVLNLHGAGDANRRALYLQAAGRLALTRTQRRPPILLVGDAGPDEKPLGVADVIRGPYSARHVAQRIGSLSRLATMQQEMMRRVETAGQYGVVPPELEPSNQFHEPKVLVVGAGIRYFAIERTLARRATLVGAFTVDTALDYLERQAFDCVVLNMRVQEAAEFTARLRRNVDHFALPVVVLADPREVDEVDAAYAAGADDVVFHSGESAVFAERVATVLKEHRLRESLKAAYARSRDRATNDALTGLFARGFLLDHLSRMVEAAAHGGRLSIVGFRIANIDEVNRQHGYAAGDHLIRQVGTVIGRLVRGEDLAARPGGGRFVIVLPDTHVDDAAGVAARLGAVLRATRFALPGASEPVSAEVVSAVAERIDGDDAESLVARVTL